MSLELAWATHEQARHACERWHYAGVLPTGKLVKVGVWEDGHYVGVVIFSRGSSPYLGRQWGLDHTEICELTRIALRDHAAPVSRILSIAVKMLRRQSPGLRLVVSFADPAKGHHGGVYQAAGWVYTGVTGSGGTYEHYVGGRWRHRRGAWPQIRRLGLDPAEVPMRFMIPKHRYCLALGPELRPALEARREPYPKPSGADGNDAEVRGVREVRAGVHQAPDGGSTPTTPLVDRRSPRKYIGAATEQGPDGPEEGAS